MQMMFYFTEQYTLHVADYEMLQKDLDIINKWVDKWQMTFNLSKWKLVRVTNKKHPLHGTCKESRLNQECLDSAGMKLKREKCAFCLPQVEYLEHIISEEGLHPSVSKVKAIKEAPKPSSVSELKSFLGLVNYYGKFLPKLSNYSCSTLQITEKFRIMAVAQRTASSF